MYRQPKLILAKIGKQCEAMLDWRSEYASVNTNCFYNPSEPPDLDYGTAFCNSKLFMFLYDQFFGALRMSGGYYQFQAPQLRVIPLRDAPPHIKGSISRLIDRVKVEDVDERTLSAILMQVNEQFYRLYGLTAEERSRGDENLM